MSISRAIHSAQKGIFHLTVTRPRAAFRILTQGSALQLCLFVLVLLGASSSRIQAQSLDQTWRVKVAGQTVAVAADGSFIVPNIRSAPQSALIQTNPNAPTIPYFARLVGFKAEGNQIRYVFSDPLEIKPGETIEVPPEQLTFSNTLPHIVTALRLTSTRTTIPAIGNTAQLTTTATTLDGTQSDVSTRALHTVYQSSDPTIAAISEDGLVTANAPGQVHVSAIHEGLTASLILTVDSPATTRNIVGFVYGPTGQPLSGAIVHIPGTSMASTSSATGRYQIPNVPDTVGNPVVRIVTGPSQLRFGKTGTLSTEFTTVDGGVLTGQTMGQIEALPCTDPDQDCLPDAVEAALGLNPNLSDSDGNGINDGLEDFDNDLLSNRFEVFIGTDPAVADSDTDGLSDGTEILQLRSIPWLGDTDGNGTNDGSQDQDNDGLLDLAEDANGNFVVDPTETSPVLADTDLDGVTDSQEIIDQTSPINEYAFEPRELSQFSFETSAFLGEQGQVPLVSTGSGPTPSFTPTGGNGYRAVAGNRLIYRVVEADNHPNINLLRGTIKFWFKPNWSSGQVGHAFGSRLLEIGEFSSLGQGNDGWWGLFLNSDRTKMTFASQGPDSPVWERYVEAVGLNFQANQWYEIELTYGPRVTYPYGHKDPLREQRHSNSYIFINGQREGHGRGVDPAKLPNRRAIDNGFALGMELDGQLPAAGIIDELRTYNYPVHTWNERILTDRNWSARANLGAQTLTLERRFPKQPELPIPVTIYRRTVGASNWGQPIQVNYQSPAFTDTNIDPGIAYEYRIWDTNAFNSTGNARIVLQQHLTAAVDLPPVHQRGKVIMMIENTIASPLQSEIANFRTNLVGDGWEVTSHLVSRQNDENLELNSGAIEIIKGLINLDIQPNRTNVVLMLGHVPVPMSGFHAADGHDNQPQNRPDHRGAWTADGFYGSTNANFFTDIGPTIIQNLDSPQNSNLIGDGKYDQDRLPQPFGIAVGRIDFARMNTFTNAPYLPGFPNHTPRSVEIELLRQYLNKNHRYRHGTLSFQRRMAGFRGFGQNRDTATSFYNAQNLAAAIFGLNHGKFLNMRSLPQRISYLFAFNEMNSFNTGMDLGWEHSNASNVYSHRTEDFNNINNEAPIGFHLVYGSYFGDWNLKVDNWMKGLLATPNAGLASVYYFPDKWRFEKMGLGAPIAVGMEEFNDTSKYSSYGIFPNGTITPFFHETLSPPRMLSILGDPTLRAHVVPPPSNPTATGSGRPISLSWTASPESNVEYHVYRSANGIDGPFVHLTAISTVTGTTFVDSFAPNGTKLYQIRAAKRELSGSGSYMNLSQGIFVTAP